MKLLITILSSAFAGCCAAAEQSIVMATAFERGWEIEFYSVGADCPEGLLSGSKFPEGERHKYVMGCWVYKGETVTISFKAHTTFTINRRQLIPRARSEPML
jgi:hypothetical protein